MGRETLKPFKVRHEITVRSSKFVKPAISVCSEFGNMFYMDLNKFRTDLVTVEGKSALLQYRNVFFKSLTKYLEYVRSKDVR